MMEVSLAAKDIPYLSTDEMREVDRSMIEDFHIELIQMMENAGRNLAHLARLRFFAGDLVDKGIIVLAGTGGNGGGAFVCARRLHNWGARVRVVLTRPEEAFRSVPAHQLDILKRMQVPILAADQTHAAAAADLIIDGLIGYSLQGAPHGTAAELIQWANSQERPILALDVPSGLDTTTGTLYTPAIRATATMTLALPKEGLRVSAARSHIGELYLADISVPPALYQKNDLAIEIGALFARSEIIRIW